MSRSVFGRSLRPVEKYPPNQRALLKSLPAIDWAHKRGDLRAAARTPPGSLTSASGADLKGVIRDRLAYRAGRTVRLRLIAAAPAGDDQQVLVNPGRLGTGQAGEEGSRWTRGAPPEYRGRTSSSGVLRPGP